MAERDVTLDLDAIALYGTLALPPEPRGLVLFAHGSGSSRFSPRNRFVASALNDGGLGTLLFDLLTEDEEERDAVTAELRFDIDLLAERLIAATDWVLANRELQRFALGYFGSSTGAAAALIAASRRPEAARAVVSRGGRPDLAGSDLSFVRAPTLLIVGGNDEPVIELNESALRQLRCEAEMRIVAGATHLFEEPGALVEVAQLARDWLIQHLGPAPRAARPSP
jgi:pimeloyl-ACP methyl ester carboxylesterase